MQSDIINLQRRMLYQIMRDDFRAFLIGAFEQMHGHAMSWNWHHDVICDSLFGCYSGQNLRLIMNVPPRSLKSFICNIAWPAWLMGKNPRIKIISISYAQDLSSKFSREQRQLMSSEWYQSIFPKTKLNPRKSGEAEFETTAGGYRMATSTGGILTGRGADIIIIDDPVKPDDAYSETQRNNCIRWLEGTLMTRLDNKQTGVMVMIMQRLHEQDPTGHFLEKGGWRHLAFSAIAETDEEWVLRSGESIFRKKGEALHPAHEPYKILLQLKKDMGTMNFNGQYQQNPIPEEGNLVKWSWFQTYENLDELPVDWRSHRTVQSWDTASKAGELNDYSVCTTWLLHEKKYYLLDVFRARLEYPELKKQAIHQMMKWNTKRIYIEDASTGTSLASDLWDERKNYNHRAYIEALKPDGDKVMRMSNVSPLIEAGKVFLPKEASWLEGFKKEIMGFPKSKYDDQVDSLSQFLQAEKDYQPIRYGRIIAGHY